MEIKVEKNVPIPPQRGSTGVTAALRKLQNIGDSIFIPGGDPSHLSTQASYAGLTGKYTARKEGDGMRVWRTKK